MSEVFQKAASTTAELRLLGPFPVNQKRPSKDLVALHIPLWTFKASLTHLGLQRLSHFRVAIVHIHDPAIALPQFGCNEKRH